MMLPRALTSTLAATALLGLPASADAKPCADSCRSTITAKPGRVTKWHTRERFSADDVLVFDIKVKGMTLEGKPYGERGCMMQYAGRGVLAHVNGCRSHIKLRVTTLRAKPVALTAVYRSLS
jgi:hypothetical protein